METIVYLLSWFTLAVGMSVSSLLCIAVLLKSACPDTIGITYSITVESWHGRSGFDRSHSEPGALHIRAVGRANCAQNHHVPGCRIDRRQGGSPACRASMCAGPRSENLRGGEILEDEKDQGLLAKLSLVLMLLQLIVGIIGLLSRR